MVFVLIRERNLERHAENGHAQAAIVRFDLVIADRKFQAIIYMEMIDAEILPIQNTPLGHAMALWSQYSFRNGDYRLSHKQIAKHPIAFEEPMHDNGRFGPVVWIDFDIAHFGEIWFGENPVHASTYPLALSARQDTADDRGSIAVKIIENRCQLFFGKWFVQRHVI